MKTHRNDQQSGRDQLLSVGEVARRLGVSVDVVRSLVENGEIRAVRTPGRHRRIPPEEVKRFKAKGRLTEHGSPAQRPASRSRPIDPGLAHPDFHENPTSLEDLEAEIARAEANRHAEAERQRLEGFKKYGRDLAPWTSLPIEWHARLFEDLEEFVTSKRVPPTLSESEAQLIVFARVQEIAKQYRESESQRLAQEREAEEQRRQAAEERREKEREAEERRRKHESDERRLKALIDHGINYARRETITGWDTPEADRARREVERTLKDKVRADWSEADVRDVVDDVLGQWADDDDDYDDDEYEEDEEGEADDES